MAAVPSIIYGLWGFFLLAASGDLPVALVEPALRLAAVLPRRHRPECRGLAAVALHRLGLHRRISRLDDGRSRWRAPSCAASSHQAPIGEREAAWLSARRAGAWSARSCCRSAAAASSAARCWPWPGPRRDGRRAAHHLAGVRHQVPDLSKRARSTISALIAGRFGEATQAQLSALLTAGFVLFVITIA